MCIYKYSKNVITTTTDYLANRQKEFVYQEGTPQYIKEMPCKTVGDLFNFNVEVNKSIVEQRYVNLREKCQLEEEYYTDEELDELEEY